VQDEKTAWILAAEVKAGATGKALTSMTGDSGIGLRTSE